MVLLYILYMYCHYVCTYTFHLKWEHGNTSEYTRIINVYATWYNTANPLYQRRRDRTKTKACNLRVKTSKSESLIHRYTLNRYYSIIERPAYFGPGLDVGSSLAQ